MKDAWIAIDSANYELLPASFIPPRATSIFPSQLERISLASADNYPEIAKFICDHALGAKNSQNFYEPNTRNNLH